MGSRSSREHGGFVRQHRDDHWRSHGNNGRQREPKGIDQQSISDEISLWNRGTRRPTLRTLPYLWQSPRVDVTAKHSTSHDIRAIDIQTLNGRERSNIARLGVLRAATPGPKKETDRQCTTGTQRNLGSRFPIHVSGRCDAAVIVLRTAGRRVQRSRVALVLPSVGRGEVMMARLI